jgi:hypothetical protein
MQVGDRQQPLLRPIERALRIGKQRDAGKHNEIALALR